MQIFYASIVLYNENLSVKLANDMANILTYKVRSGAALGIKVDTLLLIRKTLEMLMRFVLTVKKFLGIVFFQIARVLLL